jgi:hypothetical protein
MPRTASTSSYRFTTLRKLTSAMAINPLWRRR